MKKERKTLASDYIYAMLRVALRQKEERKEQSERENSHRIDEICFSVAVFCVMIMQR